MIDLKRALLAATCAAAGLLFAPAAHAQDDAAAFPSRSITVVVPFGAGGPPDAIARVVAAGLSKALGQPVVVENRVGGGSAIAASTVARAPADGHTLLVVDISFTVTPHIATNFPVDLLKDFKPIGQSAKSSFVLIASTALNTPTLEQFIARTKEKGDEIKIGHTGIGTTPHLAAMTFMNAAGVKPLLVAYRAPSPRRRPT
jgi:tripartite-type tricarboxylate transporter receptor subunit TctC